MDVKLKIKNAVKKLPVIRNFCYKLSDMELQIQSIKDYNQLISNECIDLRLKLKKINDEKINIVFVCHRPAVWGSLQSVYEELKKDESFDVKIVAIPNKKELPKLGLNHEEYESEGAETFWAEYGCINGYNYNTGEWFDIRTLKPDYVFFQQPYNVTRSPLYKSWNVSQYAKICYVAYATDFIGCGVLEETSPQDFMQNVYEYYTQNIIDNKLVSEVLSGYNNFFTRVVNTGFPRYDNLNKYINSESDIWKFARSKKHYRVMWTPRWCTNEGNCSFFDYKDRMVEFFSSHGEYELVFRPHPQAFSNWNRTGEFPTAEAEKYIRCYEESDNMSIDQNTEYFETVFSSDCLISDTSSFIADYFMTGKPIIYCHKKDMFNELSHKMAEGFYWVKNWNELQDTLVMLQKGKDPLKSKRTAILKELGMTMDGQNSAAKKIKQSILEDAKK